MEMSKNFNFDDFERQIDEALADNEQALTEIPGFRRPGEVGAVACSPLYQLWVDAHPSPVPDPPEAA